MACLWDIIRTFKHFDSLKEFMKIFLFHSRKCSRTLSLVHHNQEIYSFPYLLKTDKFLFPLIHLHNFSFVPLPVIELEYLLNLFAVFLQKVSYRTKKHDCLFFWWSVISWASWITFLIVLWLAQYFFIRFLAKFILVASTSDLIPFAISS